MELKEPEEMAPLVKLKMSKEDALDRLVNLQINVRTEQGDVIFVNPDGSPIPQTHVLCFIRYGGGISCRDISEAINVNPVTVSNWQTGKRLMNVSNVIKLFGLATIIAKKAVDEWEEAAEDLAPVVSVVDKEMEDLKERLRS